jgi:hypothetical protein
MVLPRNRGETVARVRITAVGRGPDQEGAYETTEANSDREMEPEQYRFRGGAGAALSPKPHGAARQGANIPHSSRASSGNPGLILPNVGRAVISWARRPSTPSRPR